MDINIYFTLGIIVPTISTFFIAYKFFGEVYQERYSKKIYIGGYILISIWQGSVVACGIPLFTLLSFVSLTILITIFGYLSPTRNKVFCTTMYTIYQVFLDAIVVPVTAAISGENVLAIIGDDEKFFITGIITTIVGLCTYRLVISIITRHKIAVLTKSQEIFIVLLGCFELRSIYSILQPENHAVNEINNIVIGISLGFVLLNIYLIILFETVSKGNKLKIINSLLEQKTVMDEKQYEELQSQNDTYRKIMHDIRKHMDIMQRTQNIDEEYCHDVLEAIESHSNRFQCGNQVLEVILNDRFRFCENNDIKLTYSIDDIDLSFMRKIDITTIFLNLLNNSVEACMKLEAQCRMLDITIKENQGYIVVIIINSCCEDAVSNGIVRGSQEKGHMGLGLINVRTALERYGSSLEIESENEKFQAKFIIKAATI